MRTPQKLRVLQEDQNNTKQEDRIKITFYTDPLCCWSWAFEPHWKNLLANYGNQISYRYVMGGMIPGWDQYNDPLNAVCKPIQMGPVWMHASEITHTKMDYNLWARNPPESSYPPSLAIKTVELQSAAAAEQYFFDMRRAMMEDGINISKEDILLELARQLKFDDFDYQLFLRDWQQGNGKEPFREDLKLTKFHGIGRFPTLTLKAPNGRGFMIVGYRPYKSLEEAFILTLKSKQEIHSPT